MELVLFAEDVGRRSQSEYLCELAAQFSSNVEHRSAAVRYGMVCAAASVLKLCPSAVVDKLALLQIITKLLCLAALDEDRTVSAGGNEVLALLRYTFGCDRKFHLLVFPVLRAVTLIKQEESKRKLKERERPFSPGGRVPGRTTTTVPAATVEYYEADGKGRRFVSHSISRWQGMESLRERRFVVAADGIGAD
eukprot:Polyplicarium_translucidae@DN2436_c0_g1_i2.p1